MQLRSGRDPCALLIFAQVTLDGIFEAQIIEQCRPHASRNLVDAVEQAFGAVPGPAKQFVFFLHIAGLGSSLEVELDGRDQLAQLVM